MYCILICGKVFSSIPFLHLPPNSALLAAAKWSLIFGDGQSIMGKIRQVSLNKNFSDVCFCFSYAGVMHPATLCGASWFQTAQWKQDFELRRCFTKHFDDTYQSCSESCVLEGKYVKAKSVSSQIWIHGERKKSWWEKLEVAGFERFGHHLQALSCLS